MNDLQIGDRVMMADVNERSIPAYKNMEGTVVAVKDVYCRVAWDCNRDKGEPFGRLQSSVKRISPALRPADLPEEVQE